MVMIAIMSLIGRDSKPISARNWAAVAGVIVALVILAVLMCTAGVGQGMEPLKLTKHVLATLAALLAVIASIVQAVKAKQKASYHKKASQDETQPESKWKSLHEFDEQHFRQVGTMWYVVTASALAAAVGEGVDFFID